MIFAQKRLRSTPALKRFLYASILFSVLSSVEGCRGQEPKRLTLSAFDQIVTKSVIEDAFTRPIDLDFRVTEDDGKRVYEGIYRFRATKPGQHYVCSVTVARAGVLLNPESYRQLRARLEAQSDAGSRRRLSADFPSIGSRAMRQVDGFGPGGSRYSLVMTTSDGQFDVRAAVGNLLPENVPAPSLDLEKLTREISKLYDSLAH